MAISKDISKEQQQEYKRMINNLPKGIPGAICYFDHYRFSLMHYEQGWGLTLSLFPGTSRFYSKQIKHALLGVSTLEEFLADDQVPASIKKYLIFNLDYFSRKK